jgi:hypothetical protein
MTSVRTGRTRRHARTNPSWWVVLKSTARVHRSETLVPMVTVVFVVVFALAGYLLARSGAV